MKTMIKIIVSALALLGVSAQAQVVLQDFSNVADGVNNFFYGTWEATGTDGTVSPNVHFFQGIGVYDITGTTSIVPLNDANSKLEFFNAEGDPASIGSNTFLSVTAQALGSNLAGSFRVFLIDTDSRTASASFSTTSFLTGSYSTFVGELTFQGGFDPNAIDSLIITGDQPGGTARFNVSFDNISAVSAVPEPSTYAVIAAVLALGFVVYRRRSAIRA